MNLYHLGADHFLSVGIWRGGGAGGEEGGSHEKKNGVKRGKEKTLGLKEGH